MTASVLLERPVAGVAIVTLNRPSTLNAFTQDMLQELARVASEVNEDTSLGAVVLTGAGRAFCAGRDRNELQAVGAREARRLVPEPGSSESSSIRAMEPVVIAAARGASVGGGLGLFMQADIRLASDDAYFVDGHVANAMIPSSEAWYLARRVGMARALEICVLGRRVSAHEALKWGMIDRVTTGDRLVPDALELAEEFAGVPPELARHTKAVLRRSESHPYEPSMELVGLLRALRRRSADHAKVLPGGEE